MSIRDLFPIHQRATFNGVYFVSMKFGLFLSPMAAGAQAATYGWRSSYMTLAAVMTVLSVAFVFCFEETKFVHSSNCFDEGNMKSAENNVKHRTVILEQSLQDSMPRPETPFRDFPNLRLLTSTNESLWKLLYQPIFSTMIPHVLITGIIFGAGLCFITIMASMQSIIFSEPPYRFTARELGLMHLGPFVGALLGSVYGGYLNDKFIKWASRRNSGVYEPEMRLYLIPVPVIAMAAGITIFGVTSDRVSTKCENFVTPVPQFI
ncbi:hypothetical protein QQS21_000646 [Conoideocrella luteorostrata]|uniref:Major facilitator superfamily (MFS) profile domain-containing protein n=1 Tax=Conoideocrella luteorostrata TaxID=1105319 RepID=A0AAJ0CZG4_9HYPO|nr:hypothetical protein QQS21_000646 [Conoideocrella luteorostrata]